MPGALPSWDWTMVDASCLSCLQQSEVLLGLEGKGKAAVCHLSTRNCGDWN